ATFDALRGNYQLAGDRAVFVGRYATANYLFLADGDLRVEIMPVGPREFLSDDLRTIRFESDEGGAVVAATVSQPGQSPQRAPRPGLPARASAPGGPRAGGVPRRGGGVPPGGPPVGGARGPGRGPPGRPRRWCSCTAAARSGAGRKRWRPTCSPAAASPAWR